MKQILQSLKTGVTSIADIPAPMVKRGQLLIQTSHTLVSAGTERMLVEFGKAGWIEKARQQPDKVRMVVDKIKTDGLRPTIEAVFSKLDQPLPLGYCNVGRVVAVGGGINGFAIGDRVISNGKHAEVVSVPKNLCAKVPDTVSDESAAFTVLGAIALQGIRLVMPSLGETVVVTGMGLIGLMTVQLLRAQGCRVMAIDFDKNKLALAQRFGAEIVDLGGGQDPVSTARVYSHERGVDAVIITASTTSSEPIHQAAQMCRKRGRIVLVGVTGLELSRADFFEKELSFQVSCSYGPGRYDPSYEEKGNDYPVGFVRWTEQRNFEAVLDMMADGRLDIQSLISHRFDITSADRAYELVGSSVPSLGILLRYPGTEITSDSHLVVLNDAPSPATTGLNKKPAVSFIGSGNYATGVLIPAFKVSGVRLRSVASSAGVSGTHAAKKYGFEETTTDIARLFRDSETDAVVITTRHDSHADFVLQAIRSNKHVFVEKPLCLTLEDIDAIQSAYSEHRSASVQRPVLMVGFNRRFAPQVVKIKELLSQTNEPKSFIMTVNAGAIPPEHWTQDAEIGGGRIIGEACHFIDLLRFLAGAPVTEWQRVTMMGQSQDTLSLQLKFADGSIGTLHYLANGSKSFPKERLEVFVAGRVLQLKNFRKLAGFGWPKFKKMNLWKQDKGQSSCANAFVKSIVGELGSPIPPEEIFEIARLTIEVARGAH